MESKNEKKKKAKNKPKLLEKRSDVRYQRQVVGRGGIGGRWSQSTNFHVYDREVLKMGCTTQ